MYMVFLLHVLFTTFMQNPRRPEEGVTVASCHGGAGNWNLGPLQEQQLLWTAEPPMLYMYVSYCVHMRWEEGMGSPEARVRSSCQPPDYMSAGTQTTVTVKNCTQSHISSLWCTACTCGGHSLTLGISVSCFLKWDFSLRLELVNSAGVAAG